MYFQRGGKHVRSASARHFVLDVLCGGDVNWIRTKEVSSEANVKRKLGGGVLYFGFFYDFNTPLRNSGREPKTETENVFKGTTFSNRKGEKRYRFLQGFIRTITAGEVLLFVARARIPTLFWLWISCLRTEREGELLKAAPIGVRGKETQAKSNNYASKDTQGSLNREQQRSRSVR